MKGRRTGVVTITSEQQRFLSWSADVLVYIVVLNLFVEFVDAIVIESFWISILTAVLLQALLSVVDFLLQIIDVLLLHQQHAPALFPIHL